MLPSIAPVLRRIMSALLGLVSLVGAYGAWSLGHGRESERYIVASFVLLCAGVIWFVASLNSRYHLSARDYGLIAGVLVLGLLVGLTSADYFCGGECNFGTGFCHRYMGYPGRWLRVSTCGHFTVWQGLTAPRAWYFDLRSLVADLFFWSGIGVTLLFVRKSIRPGASFGMS